MDLAQEEFRAHDIMMARDVGVDLGAIDVEEGDYEENASGLDQELDLAQEEDEQQQQRPSDGAQQPESAPNNGNNDVPH